MKNVKKSLSLALLSATVSVIAVPSVQAQVAGIAEVDTTAAIFSTKALASVYQQAETTYGSVMQLVQQRATEVSTMQQQLYKQYDANGDKQLDDAEKAKMDAATNPLKGQIQAKAEEANKLMEPVHRARIYGIEQIAMKYQPAQQQVVTAKKIQIVLAPDAIIYRPDAANITPAVTAAIDTLLPTVSIAAPADWRPQQDAVALYEQFEQARQRMNQIRAVQAAQQAQQQPVAAPGQPAPAPAPQPRPAQPDDGR
jgi:Skp family chaperone for outer membrane proteins